MNNPTAYGLAALKLQAAAVRGSAEGTRNARTLATVGFDTFFTEPDAHSTMRCQVCDAECDVRRGVYGPTGFAAAVGGQSSRHDEFFCGHRGNEWREEALRLVIATGEMPSRRVAEFMRLDLRDILVANGISL